MSHDNFERGDTALRALLAIGFEDPATVSNELPTPDGGTKVVPHVQGYPIYDLVADLCHLAQRTGLDPWRMLTEGIEHYGADCVEQAWRHSDDWGEMLQEPENIDRARRVLRVAGVPEEYDEGVLVKVGLIPPQEEAS